MNPRALLEPVLREEGTQGEIAELAAQERPGDAHRPSLDERHAEIRGLERVRAPAVRTHAPGDRQVSLALLRQDRDDDLATAFEQGARAVLDVVKERDAVGSGPGGIGQRGGGGDEEDARGDPRENRSAHRCAATRVVDASVAHPAAW